VVAEIFHISMISKVFGGVGGVGWVGGWVYGMIIIPLRGPSCKLRFARIQLG
jgi:hypothetical protein